MNNMLSFSVTFARASSKAVKDLTRLYLRERQIMIRRWVREVEKIGMGYAKA